jgi:3-deoxy-D-manno-octulosonic acid kinase
LALPTGPLPPEYETWTFPGGGAVARRDVAPAVRAALAASGSLYAWAAVQPGREAFAGRGAAYGVMLGDVGAVVRHARRGGYVIAPILGDRFVGRPRFFRELAWSRYLAGAGVATPAFLAGAWERSGLVHRADVATERVPGRDLAAFFFEGTGPSGEERAAALQAVGRLIRRLHDARVVHPDLQIRNVLVGGTPLGAWLLDIDSCRGGATAARRRNLRRFFRSWEKWNRTAGPRLTAADRRAFEAAYAEPAA